MLRYLSQFQSIRTFSKQVETQKKAKIVMKPKPIPAELQQQERINKIYFEFQAIKTDPLSIIKQRFIKKKKLLSNRRLYLPNKREYMMQLDTYLRQIQVKHNEQIVRESYALPRTIGQKIEMQLEHERLRFFFSFLKEDKWVIIIASGLITAMAFYEIFFCYRY